MSFPSFEGTIIEASRRNMARGGGGGRQNSVGLSNRVIKEMVKMNVNIA